MEDWIDWLSDGRFFLRAAVWLPSGIGTEGDEMIELIFEVAEDEVDGGYTASALGHGIHTQGDSLDELRENVRDAVACHFDSPGEMPSIIRLHFVRDEVLAV